MPAPPALATAAPAVIRPETALAGLPVPGVPVLVAPVAPAARRVLLAVPAPAVPQAALDSRQRLPPLPTPAMGRARKSVSRVAALLIFSRVILVAAAMTTTAVA